VQPNQRSRQLKFDLAQQGWPLDGPVGWCVDLARHVRALLA
jgi:hypothetical protein